ncbi:hypothetical protein PUNSTDRAFT_63586 [Punctularia strigosozonata HHB-11173 SS5]|uniref:uncharacterized protein n=1 Tax=Punctularia strigosozonata (strain HHB-11173) TaxID=741275 RepID=UPI000441690B|nr:uncharacterized protein PUNSTDRAFT_63586 [Punctularia strigosozonata HHB-11173 SS5]EIN11286.1 hypothetical protein PUNSTDRAFT_63586 [Punctularia strigosozonata HHB-11173 SS5]
MRSPALTYLRITSRLLWLLLLCLISPARAWIQYASTGNATMTHYTMAEGTITACGCTGDSTKFPTAALSESAYGSTTAYGPSCGRCFNLTLLNTFTPDPPFIPDTHPSVIVKVTDHCPLGGDWCNATDTKPNKQAQGGEFLNFDLVWPSKAIPDDFFPSNKTLYGTAMNGYDVTQDFGVWNISYEVVPCSEWKGWNDASALGSVPTLGDGACCPADPTNSSNTCPSFSDANGIPYVTLSSYHDTAPADARLP